MCYLVCSLTSESVYDVEIKRCEEWRDAKEVVVDNHRWWAEGEEIGKLREKHEGTWRMETSLEDGTFIVSEIIEVNPTNGDTMAVTYHGYNGVDFEVACQGDEAFVDSFIKTDMDEMEDKCSWCDRDDNSIDDGMEVFVWEKAFI